MKLKLDPETGLVFVPVLIMGPKGSASFEFVLDTGATTTVISERLLEHMGYDLKRPAGWTDLATVSSIDRAPLVQVTSIRCMRQERKRMIVSARSIPVETTIDGMLGLDFLLGLRLVLDFRGNMIELG